TATPDSGRRRVTFDHAVREDGKILRIFGGTSVMRNHPEMFGSETQRKSRVEVLYGAHLAIKPPLRVWTKRIGPAQPGPEVSNPEFAQPFDRIIESVVFIVKPLADPQARREMRVRQLGRSIFPDYAHVIVAIVGTALSFFVASCGCPSRWQIVKTVPVD